MMTETNTVLPSSRAAWPRVLLRGTVVVLGALLTLAFVAAVVARSWQQELAGSAEPQTVVVLAMALILSGVFWLVALLKGKQITEQITTRGLALIGTIAALHFVVAAISRTAGVVLQAMLGPYAVFISGLGDEGIPCLLTAVLVVLRPRVGVVALMNLAVFLLMVITSGTFGFSAAIFISVSIALHELMLALTGVTVATGLPSGQNTAPTASMLRVALALGAANAATLGIQFVAYRLLYRLFLPNWYVFAIVIVSGLIYGGCGAALGTCLGYRLRRTTA